MPQFIIDGQIFDTGEDPLFNCHETAYRFRNSLNVGEALPLKNQIINELWPNQFVQINRIHTIGMPGVVGDISMIQPGDIVGFWTQNPLNGRFMIQHTMIAQNHNTWIGTNNLGTFGVAGFAFNNIDQINFTGAVASVGWYGQNGDLYWHHSTDGIPPNDPIYITRGEGRFHIGYLIFKKK